MLEAEPEDATAALRKRSRVHEVYSADPNDDNYSLCVCQCRENVQGGRVCGGRIKSRGSTKSLWNHVQKKHPCTFAKLNNQGDIAHTSLAEVLATPAELSVSISYQQMVDQLSRAPVQTLSAAIEALQQARELREA